VSALLTQLSWTNHLLIMSGSKSDEEREFYMRLAVKEPDALAYDGGGVSIATAG
ncbi:MAG: hypothetical protein IJS85_00685, partial [Clostridiales bacterium]|nr:hypothetical protein [Clostridiales bacterium]